ncbi:B12 binding domain protein [compost metagenome]
MPAEGLIRYLKEQPADLMAVSITMTYHVSEVQRLIASIRTHAGLNHIKILVGGMPFNIDRTLWEKVGADGYAPDAKGALEVASQLISQN